MYKAFYDCFAAAQRDNDDRNMFKFLNLDEKDLKKAFLFAEKVRKLFNKFRDYDENAIENNIQFAKNYKKY